MVKINTVDCFKDFIVLTGRQDGFSQLWVVKEKDGKHVKFRIKFDEASYAVSSSVNHDFNTNKYRFVYSSMTTPRTTFDFDVEKNELVFLKEKPCPNYDRSLYQSERIEATATDGTKVPISVVYRKDLRQKDRQPLHLGGCGSYRAGTPSMPYKIDAN